MVRFRLAQLFNINSKGLDASNTGTHSTPEESRRRRVLQRFQRRYTAPVPPFSGPSQTDHAQIVELYQPLGVEDQQTRVLDLYPGHVDDAVRCKLRIVSLIADPPPVYETTSYAWGAADLLDEIIVNDTPTAVTASSAAVLRRCRDEKDVRTVWIDAICINQLDPEERSQQINLMASIYRLCWRNIIYLGDPRRKKQPFDLSQGLQQLINHKMVAQDLENEAALEEYLYVGNISEIINQSARSPPKDIQDLVSLVKQILPVFRAPWFKRLWVIQESILPPMNTCYWGAEIISLRKLLLAARCIMSWEQYLPKGTDGTVYAAYVLHTYTVILTESWANNGELLAALMGFSDHLKVTVQHDRLYGLLGLFQAAARLEELPELLRPDYDRPWTVVLADATKYIFRERHSLHTLNDVEHSASSLDDLAQPSWVAYPLENGISGGIDGSQKFRASGTSIYEPRLQETSTELGVEGFILGVVSEIAATQEEPRSPCSVSETYSRAYAMASRSSHGVQAAGSTDEIVAYTLVGGKTWDRQRVTGSCGGICERAMVHTDLWPKVPPMELVAAAQVPEGTDQEAARYTYAMWEVIPSRTFFSTEDSYFGLGPPYTAASDVLAILLGYHLPVILRPSGDHVYRFVGPCYVHGIMDGEVVTQRDAGGIRPELLVLV